MKHDEMVLVNWRDTTGKSAWQDRSAALRVRPVVCTTVGFLLRRDTDCLTVASTKGIPGRVADVTVIPRNTVVSCHSLREDSR